MALNKAIFYFNIRSETGQIYGDLNNRLTAWETKVKGFLGDSYDVLVVPTLNRDTELFFVPRPPDAGPQLLGEATKGAPKV